ncbi:MAG: Tex family protein [Acidobacteriota bacterium]
MLSHLMNTIVERIARELSVEARQVEAARQLLDDGATVPFISRYRKEATGGLDDTQLRAAEERLGYLRELEERRGVILRSIEEQGKLTPELEAAIGEADTKVRLEDLYLPYRPRRRTKAQIAREAGLEPLAHTLLQDPRLVPEEAARAYIGDDKNVPDVAAALDGARQILMEEFSEEAELIGVLRDFFWQHARLRSRVVADRREAGVKFSDYFRTEEPVRRVPSHRALAILRGRNEGILKLHFVLDDAESATPDANERACLGRIAARFGIEDRGRPADCWLLETVRWAWRVKILTRLETDAEARMRESAEVEAIAVFGKNLHDLLLAAPAGQRATIGLDPGYRTGVKVAVVDKTGKLLETATIYPHEPRREWDQSIAALAALCSKHSVDLVAIGNGTASRETDKLALDLAKQHPELKLSRAVVSEAGASVYSASELAAKELPELDVSLRGAVSIARRLQDPLAELVKIDPKSIGVGQYQHDVNQSQLARKLDSVVEDCVNAVGVDVNTASTQLLARVSGLTSTLATNIVAYRDEHGAFRDRTGLKRVPRLGAKTFEQAAGFLRIMNGDNPLDRSAVHPEAYPVVERIIARTGRSIRALMGDGHFLRRLVPGDFTDENFGEPTVKDILAELEKPGRDPRPEFRTAAFREAVNDIQDLKPEMVLEGVVTNVTNFGAFVDVGVHQDGLVHVSAMADRFVEDPQRVVKAGDVVKVKVLAVDLERRRIALSMRLTDSAQRPEGKETPQRPAESRRKKEPAPPQTAMAAAFAKIKLKS